MSEDSSSPILPNEYLLTQVVFRTLLNPEFLLNVGVTTGIVLKLNEVDFNISDDKHVFGSIYEGILQELRDAGNEGKYYPSRAKILLQNKADSI